MLRRLSALLIALGLGAGVWLRSEIPPASSEPELAVTALPLASGCCAAGPLRLLEAWQLHSRHAAFGGYSALLQRRPGQLMALSDRGYYLEFSEPGTAPRPPRFGPISDETVRSKANRDYEAATIDPVSGKIWIAQEGRNTIERHGADSSRQTIRIIPDMQTWSRNSGPEAMVRLRDGRFVVLCECTGPGWWGANHPALLFRSDPTLPGLPQAFSFAGVAGYRPTDMAQLPDGRVLILARRLLWPLPPRFAIKVLIADPAEIRAGQIWQAREIADISAPWPVDNYEGLALERLTDGRLIGWIISDENSAATQRVLLLKVQIDESRL